MLRRALSHPLFYIVLLGGLVALFVSVRPVNGGSRLGMRTSQKHPGVTAYQPKSHIDNSVIGVTMLHLQLMSASTARDISFIQATDVLRQSDALLGNNVINYLQNASNRRLALVTYTRNLDKVTAQASDTLSELQLQQSTFAQEYSQCSSDKSAADNQFFEGLRTIDGGMLQQGFDDALTHGTCATRARISSNAYRAVIAKVRGYDTAMQQMNTLLSENEDLIVANVDLFEDSYLEKLTVIRNQLQAVNRAGTID